MNLFDIFIRPPGDFLYFLTVIAISLACLLMVLGQRLRRPDSIIGRYTFAMSGVTITWLMLLVGAVTALLLKMEAVMILPTLERAANTLVLLLLAWVFLTAEHNEWGRLPFILLIGFIVITVIGYVATAVQWVGIAGTIDFNATALSVGWAFAPLLLSLLAFVINLRYFNLIVDAPLKLVFFLLVAVGYGVTLWLTVQNNLPGNYAGPVRLAFITAQAISIALVYRAIMRKLDVEIQAAAELTDTQKIRAVKASHQQPVPATPHPAPVVDRPTGQITVEREAAQLFKALGLILEDVTPEGMPLKIIAASLDILKADIGAILRLHDANYADVVAIYDRPMRRALAEVSINLDFQPTLVNAIERLAQRPLLADRNYDELRDLYNRLNISQIGPVYFQPLVRDKQLIAVLMIALPYSGRELNLPEEETLKGIGVIAGGLLALSDKAQEATRIAEERAIQAMVQGLPPHEIADDQVLAARQEMQASLQLARDQIAELSKQVVALKIELDSERNRIANALGDTEVGLSISQRIVAINDEQQRLREERDLLSVRLQQAETALAGATAPDDEAVVKNMLAAVERERDDLAAQRDRLQAQLQEIRANDGMMIPEAFDPVLEQMATEKARLESERDQFRSRLEDLQREMAMIGVDGTASSLAHLIGKLYEDRSSLRQKNETLTREIDNIYRERAKLQEQLRTENERETLLKTLQNELKHLAADREAATRDRDQFRTENMELAAKLDSVKEHRARLLAQVSGYQMELQESHEEQAKLHRRLQKIADELSEVTHLRDQMLAEKQALLTERDQLLARAEGDRGRMQQVGEQGVGALQNMISDLSQQRNSLEHELNQTRRQLAETMNKLEALKAQTASPAVEYKPQNPDLIMGLVQELRTPMTSIMGYIDLLLGESAGILGEMQRKFLQRVGTNISRLESMLDDLIRVTALDTGNFRLTPEPIDLVSMIEDAVTNSSLQFREKGLTVNLNIDDQVPLLNADRDAVLQIIGELLTNAYLVSPPDNQITITVRREKIQSQNGGKQADGIFVAIEDRGGGIAPDDEARVFSRKYKAGNPLIQGLGDTGVGLSVAKALVEAHHGKLWLQSREHVGSAFCFVLPTNAALEVRDEA